VIIGAHPDDELLWFNAIIRDVDAVIVVFRDFWAQPGIGTRRAAALADYPRDNVTSLDISEAGAYGCADWLEPKLNEHGIVLGLEASRREITRVARNSLARVAATADPVSLQASGVARAYALNHHAIYAALKPRLHADMNVFTHNPWGEYGHEEHVQVFRVVDRLRREIGFKLWMSNYCTDRSMPLAMRYFRQAPGEYLRLPTDKAFAERVADVYKRHDCWTWDDDWAWFDEECYMEAPRAHSDSAAHRHLFPLNFFTIDKPRAKKWLPLALTMSAASAALSVAIAEAI
jgi:LmbE family N-acetylglucosaminyl deacetylase